jgi:L-ascorbate oxidase
MTQRRRVPASMGALLFSALAPAAAFAAPLYDPPVFASASGNLDLVVVAKPSPVKLSDSMTTTAWVYDVCPRTAPTQADCTNGQHPLGGVRLQLNAGDTLKIRLVNKLPPVPDAAHIADNPALIGNPTNLHTHGLIVEPHRAEGPSDPYGDYVFLELLNPDNPTAPAASTLTAHASHGSHLDIDFINGAVDYAIQIPKSHPSGIFWFHPHVHGLALNQVSAGLSGVITIGKPEDVCGDAKCAGEIRAGNVRHIVLKDMQVLPGGVLQTQEDPDFCGGADQDVKAPLQGGCAGVPLPPDADYTGGTWFHTVNGQVFPSIAVGPHGDVWRFLNSSGSRSYEVTLGGNQTGAPVLMQVISIDGVTIDSLALNAQGAAAMKELLGGKVKPVPCPKPADGSGPDGLCTTMLRLMPSSRAEVRVVGQQDSSATLRTAQFFTGGDTWPAADLAAVTLPASGTPLAPLALGTAARDALSPAGVLGANSELRPRGSMTLASIADARAAANLPVTGSAHPGHVTPATSIAIDPALKLGLRGDPQCKPLPAGHRRRIYFGNPTPGQDGFGLGYAEIDERGREVPGTRKEVTVFDPSLPTICVTLGPNGQPVKEVWEVLNLTDEDHNFHIHQTRFRLIRGGAIPGTTLPSTLTDGLVMHDNVPLPRANNTDNCDGTIDAYLRGYCRPNPIVVEIPFRQIGDFVYHCHILEHEDGGMMARIRVVAPRS